MVVAVCDRLWLVPNLPLPVLSFSCFFVVQFWIIDCLLRYFMGIDLDLYYYSCVWAPWHVALRDYAVNVRFHAVRNHNQTDKRSVALMARDVGVFGVMAFALMFGWSM